MSHQYCDSNKNETFFKLRACVSKKRQVDQVLGYSAYIYAWQIIRNIFLEGELDYDDYH